MKQIHMLNLPTAFQDSQNNTRYQMLCVKPEYTRWNAAHEACTILEFITTPGILPEGLKCDIIPSPLYSLIAVPAITLEKIWLNPLYSAIPLETLVHECVHHFQRMRMGSVFYAATYMWHSILHLGSHPHAKNQMEAEARRIARAVIEQCYTPGLVLNITAAINQIVPDWNLV